VRLPLLNIVFRLSVFLCIQECSQDYVSEGRVESICWRIGCKMGFVMAFGQFVGHYDHYMTCVEMGPVVSCPCYFWAFWSLVRKKGTSWLVFHEEIIIGELLALWQLTVAPPGHHVERRQQNSRLFFICLRCRLLSRLCSIGTEVLGCKRRCFVCSFWDSCVSCL
jgi:hypothetical protein